MTMLPAQLLVFLAQTSDKAEAWKPYTREELQQLWPKGFRPTFLPSLPWLLAGIALLMIVLVLWNRHRQIKAHERSAPLAAFMEVAKAVGLSLRDRLLLMRIAHQQRLPSPLTLLLSPATLEHHANLYLRVLLPWRRSGAQRHVLDLRTRLFAES